jgi:hypothetical protein
MLQFSTRLIRLQSRQTLMFHRSRHLTLRRSHLCRMFRQSHPSPMFHRSRLYPMFHPSHLSRMFHRSHLYPVFRRNRVSPMFRNFRTPTFPSCLIPSMSLIPRYYPVRTLLRQLLRRWSGRK